MRTANELPPIYYFVAHIHALVLLTLFFSLCIFSSSSSSCFYTRVVVLLQAAPLPFYREHFAHTVLQWRAEMKLSNPPRFQPRFLIFVSSRRQRRWRRLLYDPNSITIFLFSLSYPSNFFLYWLRLFRFFASPTSLLLNRRPGRNSGSCRKFRRLTRPGSRGVSKITPTPRSIHLSVEQYNSKTKKIVWVRPRQGTAVVYRMQTGWNYV